jgi:hypothetical protein
MFSCGLVSILLNSFRVSGALLQARYTMGARSVSMLQYNENDLDLALVHVDVKSLRGCPAESCEFQPQFVNASAAPTKKTPDISGKSDSKSSSSDTNDDSAALSSAVSNLDIGLGLRKRNVPSDEVTIKDADDATTRDVDKRSNNENRRSTVHDPLRWFGVLVPRPLKQSQQAFQNGVELACRIASLQSTLLSLRENYVKLLQDKRRLSSVNSDAGVES